MNGGTKKVERRCGASTKNVAGVVALGARRGQDLLGPPLGGGSCDVTL